MLRGSPGELLNVSAILHAALIAVLALLAGTAFGLGQVVLGAGLVLAVLAALNTPMYPHSTDEAERAAIAATPTEEP